MLSRLFILLFWVFLHFPVAWADTPAPESAPSLTLESPPESLPSGSYGQILFFPDQARPSDERHRVKAGQNIDLCVRLSPQASQFIDRLREKAIGMQLILEDSATPPHRLTMVLGNRLFRLKADGQECFGGDWTLPGNTVPGTYQVAALFWAASDQSYYSLRRYLYEFARVEEIEVENPDADTEAPKLLGFRTYKRPPFLMSYEAGVFKIKLEQAFELSDEGSGIEGKSLRVVYRLGIGDDRHNTENARCRRVTQTKSRYRCEIVWAAPDFFWNSNPISLSLDSISVRDKAGNLLRIDGEEAIRAVVPEGQMVFEFQRKKKWKDRHDRDLKREPPLPARGLGPEPAIAETQPQSG